MTRNADKLAAGAPTSRFACTAASAERGEPMVATASRVKSWLLVEVRGAWGRNAVVDSELGTHVSEDWHRALNARGVRVLAIRRDLDAYRQRSAQEARLVHLAAGRPGNTAPRAQRLIVDDLRQVVEATESLVADGECGRGWADDDELYALVCTNGRHDPCCATMGRPLIRALRQSRWNRIVWECSHVGGDRFAGNLVLLPDGLYFGRCDAGAAEQVLGAYETGRVHLDHYRGRSTLSLLEQAAEHFLRADLALDQLDAIRTIETIGRGRVLIGTGPDAAGYIVIVARRASPAPSPLTCRGPDGQSHPTFELIAIERTD